MNFTEEEEREYISDREEQDEDDEGVIITSKFSLSSPASQSSSSNKNKSFLTQQQSLWFGDSFEAQQDHKNPEPHLNFNKKLELMDLSLGNINEADKSGAGGGASASASGPIEQEHMFDKVVTPSDVGKLNRLVIPKQHAEKYFPLDSSSNEKGLLLNFEDRGGKPWRFRYSYWNSSQSYVMTKGWSRFVKEKKLDAGDIVSFQRGVGEESKHRLFIDWRRRPTVPDPASFTRIDVQNQLHFPQSVRWGRLYSLPPSLSMPRQYHEQPPLQQLNYGIQPYQHRHNQQYHYHHQPASSYGSAAHYYLSPQVAHPIGALHHQGVVDHAPLVIDSVPVSHGKTVGKRLRLFGVNMAQDEPSSSIPVSHDTVGSLSPPAQLRTSEDALPTTQAEYSKKGKTSLSFDFDA